VSRLRTGIICQKSIDAERAVMNTAWEDFLDREAARCGRIDEALADLADSTRVALAQVKAWGLS
jgi:hypothetical protein